MDAGSYFSERKLAEHWGISPKTLQRWRIMRVGPPYLRIGRAVRYRLCDVEQYEQTALTKCDVSRPNGKPHRQDEQSQPPTPLYPTVRDALLARTASE
jgi:hypothetical protein